MSKPLNPRQERFVQEYLKDGNATQAYIRAGYAPKAADVCGTKLLGNARVSAAVKAGREKLAAKAGLTVERVVNGLLREATGEAEDSTAPARISAWAHLGKHLGMFIDRSEIKGSLTLEQLIAEGMKPHDAGSR